MKIDEASNGRAITLTEGETLDLTLPENPTTGFRWIVESNGAPVCALRDDTYEASAGPPGAGGQHRWSFQAVQPGAGRIALAYRRPWGQSASPAKTFAVTIRVSPKG